MNKIEIQKIKTGLDNFRFNYINTYIDHGDEVEYTYLSKSPSGEYYMVESDIEKNRYFKRLSDAMNLFLKRSRMDNVWIDLCHPIDHHDSDIDLEDLSFIELDDLRRL
jgi:hypothetical protein